MINKFLNKHFIYYVIIGAIATGVDTGIFYLLSDKLSFGIILANCISVTFGILTSFYLNSHFNFKKKDKFLKRLMFFSVVLLFGMALGTTVLALLVNLLGFNKIIAKVLSVVFAGIFQFLFNSSITFKN